MISAERTVLMAATAVGIEAVDALSAITSVRGDMMALKGLTTSSLDTLWSLLDELHLNGQSRASKIARG
jgi:hypothetical protein